MNESSKLKLGSAEKEEDFYRELDKKSLHQSCCTCQTLAIFFVGLLLILSSSIFFLYWQITHGGGFNFNVTQRATAKDFQSKLTSAKPDKTGAYRLALTSDELNSVMNEGLSVSDFILKDMVLSLNPNEILIYGNLIKPLNSKIVMSVVPQEKNEKLFLEVNKITAGSINLPSLFNNQATDSLNALLDAKMASFYQKATVSTVTLGSNAIIIIGKNK